MPPVSASESQPSPAHERAHPTPAADPAPAVHPDSAGPLAESDAKILELESQLWKYTATKERAIRDRLGIEPTDYYLRLRELVDDPAARRAHPALLSRLDEMLQRARRRCTPGSGRRDPASSPQQTARETP